MNILLLGSGGREHAFTHKIIQSPLVEKLFVAPGNPGTAGIAENVALGLNDFEAQEQFCLQNNVSIIVAGPEEPLVNGVYDYFAAKYPDGKISVIGPSKQGALMEGSKAFAKEFMLRHNIPTAAYKEFNAANLNEGADYINSQTPPIVLKADGLAAGKGVVITPTREEAIEELNAMIAEAKFGAASAKVVIEEFLKGIEFSVFVLTDGDNYKILPTAKDYKRIGEGDTGLNTGGMGAVSPVPFATDELMARVERDIIQPTIAGFKKDGIVYKGFVYIGLMLVGDTPYVIEYNCRMGDPETQVVMPRLTTDLVQLFVAVSKGELDKETIEISSDAACTVVVASGGYPEHFEKGKTITGLEDVQDSIVFHAGTKFNGSDTVTNGGRVLTITSLGNNITAAVQKSLASITKINFEGKYHRSDIGYEFK